MKGNFGGHCFTNKDKHTQAEFQLDFKELFQQLHERVELFGAPYPVPKEMTQISISVE
ncbi:MAG: hypothetical protein OQK24_01145 [Magnetovibrio sp.]|nr:hypothetical protein [Magnetovibrio sp.]